MAPKTNKMLLLTFLDLQKNGSSKVLKIRTDYQRFGGVNEGFRASIIHQMKEGKERSKLVVLVLLGDRIYGGGGRISGRRRLTRVREGDEMGERDM